MLLSVRDLDVAYGDAQALWGVSLDVDAAEIVAVIGPNGAGKSTLINAIAGVRRPRGGEILVNGVNVGSLPPHRVCDHGVALVPEGRRLFPKMTVLENLEIGGYRSGARAMAARTLAHVFDLFPILAERREQVVGTMSGGQQQMVAIGRALMAQPLLVLMDEPSLGLAPSIVGDMFRIIQSIHREGLSVLLVEQNVVQALEVSSRVYVMEQGRVRTSGASSDILARSDIREAYLGL